jgi:hypothetical protein
VLRENEIVITDDNWREHVEPIVDGQPTRRGLIPRDFSKYPQGFYKSAPAWDDSLPLIPRSEWAERCRDMAASQSRLSDIRLAGNNGQPIPSLDQNGRGYCWMHSGVSCVTLLRAVMGLPYVGLSAYGPACIIKRYRDEGGWGAQGMDFLAERGVPSEAHWPMQATNSRYDTPETWANAALHRVVEGWADMASAQYDRNLSFEQNATCWLSRIPTVADFNFWGHSVCGVDLVDGSREWGVTRASSGKLLDLRAFNAFWGFDNPVTTGFACRIWNSWGDSWSERGMGVLTGNKAIPDGSVAPRTTMASAA